MSHAEAFGLLRSFVVGLEVKARDLRKVLESSRDQDGKWVNGKDGMGIGERCARGEHETRQKHLARQQRLLLLSAAAVVVRFFGVPAKTNCTQQ